MNDLPHWASKNYCYLGIRQTQAWLIKHTDTLERATTDDQAIQALDTTLHAIWLRDGFALQHYTCMSTTQNVVGRWYKMVSGHRNFNGVTGCRKLKARRPVVRKISHNA